ncbi:cytokinin dehydrogenase 3 [Dorcoceras hygrometricum]|uniref:cytokinin dehydrogenase n=1 Tax=Dorcoceras hygrometricum TaxID=472368 RepID=A0A2Z7CHB3_9LAMI|nr:cytokinin dehydrogenase 3 [Dorcoceras hygrometricum]
MAAVIPSLILPSCLILFILIFLVSCATAALPDEIPQRDIAELLISDPESTSKASGDYGNLVRVTPSAVFRPSTVDDIISLVKLSNNLSNPFSVAARGRGHSVRGQAMAADGVVVEMVSLQAGDGVGIRVSWNPALGFFADVGGEQIWSDVLKTTLEHGLAPVSWTDYLYLSVGGTLSNGGISGQSFLHGPQISNVHELDVVTGTGDFITCSKEMNSELFFAVLGGLGQFGIITRARILLQKAPSRAKWVRLIYNDFSKFTRDQEHLISLDNNGPNYVEGSLITDNSPPNNWRSSFYSSLHQSKISSLLKSNQGLLFSIEVVKYYDDLTANTIDEEVEDMVQDFGFVPGFIFKKDVPVIDFLNRVAIGDDHKSEAHPWLNLFVPKSAILDFNDAVFVHIMRRHNHTTSGPILFYPFNRIKWDDRMFAVIPDEEIFYTMGLLHSSMPDEVEIYEKLNNEILEFCEKSGMKIKQYLPHYKSKEDWVNHFGPKWDSFQEMKTKYDPRMILSPGQRIFKAI